LAVSIICLAARLGEREPSRATILTGMTARNHGVVDTHNSTETGLT